MNVDNSVSEYIRLLMQPNAKLCSPAVGIPNVADQIEVLVKKVSGLVDEAMWLSHMVVASWNVSFTCTCVALDKD